MQLILTQTGEIERLAHNGVTIPFTPENGFGFAFTQAGYSYSVACRKDGDFYRETKCGVRFEYGFETHDNYVKLNLKIENISEYDFYVENVYFKLGINSFMDKCPDWRDKFFPTLLRLEKTHFYGYFLSPEGQALAVIGDKPIASYDISYAPPSMPYYNNGHRIYNTSLVLLNNAKAAKRLPQRLKYLKKDESYENSIYLVPLENVTQFEKAINQILNIPVINAEKYTFEKGELFDFTIAYQGDYNYTLTAPSGKIYKNEKPVLNEYGLYSLQVLAENGYQAESYFFVRKDWDFYLYGAAKEAVQKQQKASTHTESWYGLFSLFLAQKYFDDKPLFDTAKRCFDEIMPLMFCFDKALPLVIPNRIQNSAMFISLLVDLYETDRENNLKYLQLAALYGDFLLTKQGPDGAYRNRKVHYTCVIYIAKSLLELVKAEKTSNDQALVLKSQTHYVSVKKAIDELVLHLDDIDTEGELTFEDGMISCSALQIAYFALTLDKNERAPYIKAAEHMLEMHACLEQRHSPDCRTNGCSLRFWESQYDVMVHGNTFNSPHGWTGWTVYAQYYLYRLTGKKQYLLRLMNTISACAQLLSLDGNLRWAFFPQPYLKHKTLVPDTSKPIQDGYSYTAYATPAYRGKYEEKEYSEEYVEMISDWYRVGQQRITGGYTTCWLYLAEDVRCVDNQGGACDNDVHEIFKCLEETVFRKAFIHQNDDGSLLTYGCAVENGVVTFNGIVSEIVYYVQKSLTVSINGAKTTLNGFSALKF